MSKIFLFHQEGLEPITAGIAVAQMDVATLLAAVAVCVILMLLARHLKTSQKAFRYNEERFRALIEHANDIICLLDDKGHFIYVSPSVQRILGYPPDELMGINAFDLLAPEERDLLFSEFERKGKKNTPYGPVEHLYKHKKGHFCILESVVKDLQYHSAVNAVVVNSRNITKRKAAERGLRKSHQELEDRVRERTEELTRVNKALGEEIAIRLQKETELENANQAKNDFMATFGHEIRTPLNAITGFAELLSGMTTNEEQLGYLHTITDAARHLLSLINDILDLSKLEAGKMEIRRVPTSLADLFHETHRMFNARLKENGVRFQSEIDPKLPQQMMLDDIRLRQILVNLMDNAVKFTEEGYVKLSASAVGKMSDHGLDFVIRVEDSGIGIPENKCEAIFESFRQESSGTSRKFGGAGLGLAICKQLVQLMGGNIKLTSCPEKGSRFDIYLPGVAKAESQENLFAEAAKAPAASQTVSGETSSDLQHGLETALKKHPELGRYLPETLQPHLIRLKEGMTMSEISTIATALSKTGTRFECRQLTEFGRKLQLDSETFNIENINRRIKHLSVLLDG